MGKKVFVSAQLANHLENIVRCPLGAGLQTHQAQTIQNYVSTEEDADELPRDLKACLRFIRRKTYERKVGFSTVMKQ